MTTNRERWTRLEQVFADALALPAAARSSFLRRACADDADLVEEVEDLLDAHAAPGVLDTSPHAVETVATHPSLAPGSCLGAWRIDTMIGRGGMGEVYAATRIDAAFEQRAALKLLRYEAVAETDRFQSERRILARLEHPGIARLLDGGMAADGRPYTVLEYVEGQAITDYCRARTSSLHERLALFAQVCEAVAFAHRNLVIHRDLKPDNILVDARGGVKLLDFGIAKLLDTTSSTRDVDNTTAPFTPDYAAPEQLSGQPITTGTDIYALGVLLFELLTGERPLRTRGLPSSRALALILDREAPAPSRLARERADAPLPARLLIGDLDAIVAKCLRKEANHRYETVNGLKADVDRHLRTEPVLARDGARAYVFGRLLTRYRWPVAGIGALILALAVGLGGTIWQARRAETQAARATAVLGFVEGLFEGNDPAVTKGETTTARELLDRGARRVDREFADQADLSAQLKHTIGKLYLKLGLLNQAQSELVTSIALTPKTGVGNAELRFVRLLDLARVDYAASATDAGLAHLDEASLLLTPDALRAERGIAIDALRAQLLRQRGDDQQALQVVERAYAVARQVLGESHPDTLEVTESYADLLGADGRDREALPLFEQLAQQRRDMLGEDDPRTLTTLSLFANVLSDVDQSARARAFAEDVLARRRKVLGDAHPDTALSLFQVSQMHYQAGLYSEADLLVRQSIALLRSLQPINRNLLADALHEQASIAYQQGRLDDAEKDYRESERLRTELYGADHRAVLETQLVLALIVRGSGHVKEAIELIRHVVAVRTRIGVDTPESANALRALGSALSANGEHVEAIEQLGAAEQMSLRLYGESHPMPQQTRVLLGQAYLAAGEMSHAAEVTARALARLELLHPQGHPDVARTKGNLSRIELKLGNTERALELSRQQYEFVSATLTDPGNPRVAETQGLLGECLLADGQREAGQRALDYALEVLELKQPKNPQLAGWRDLLKASR